MLLIHIAFLCILAAADVPVVLQPGRTTVLELNKIPPDGREVFAVTARAGQTLFVEIDPKTFGQFDENSNLQVFGPSGVALEGGLDGQWLGRFQESGIHRIAVAMPARWPYWIRFTLMDPSDPRLTAGIMPASIEADLSALGVKERFELQPFAPPSPIGLTADECWPGHVALLSQKIQIRIFAVDGLAPTFWRDDNAAWPKRLALLQKTLEGNGPMPPPIDLPAPSAGNVGLEFAAAQKRIPGGSFRIVRWLANFSAMPAHPCNPMTYVAEGISQNGRYFLLVRAEIAHPAVDGLPDLDDGPELQALKASVAKQLAAASPDSFQPSLRILDGIVASLRIPR